MTEFSLAVDLMQAEGGRLQRLDGEEVVVFDLPPFRVNVFQTYRDLGRGEARAALELVADLPELSAVANALIGNPADAWNTIHTDRWSRRLAEIEVTRDLVRAQITGLLDRVRALDPGAVLARCRAECPDFEGGLQLCHLAALALAGDGARLRDYHGRMLAGDRLNFVPMITPDLVQRAVERADRPTG